MSDWEVLTTRGGNRPRFAGRKRGRPLGRKTIMPRTKKDLQQDQKIKNVERHVKKIINQEELNHVDTFVNGVALVSDPGTANTILLNPLVQGDTNVTRSGDEVVYTSIQVRGIAIQDPDNVLGTECRIIVFWDKFPNGVAPTAATLLDNSVITQLTESPYNSDYYKRFKIILDRRFVLNANVGVQSPVTSVEGKIVSFDFRKQMQKKSNYGLGNAGTIADIARGACYLLLLSQGTTAGGLAPLARIGIRMIYKDL